MSDQPRDISSYQASQETLRWYEEQLKKAETDRDEARALCVQLVYGFKVGEAEAERAALQAYRERPWADVPVFAEVPSAATPECTCPYPNPRTEDIERSCPLHGSSALIKPAEGQGTPRGGVVPPGTLTGGREGDELFIPHDPDADLAAAFEQAGRAVSTAYQLGHKDGSAPGPSDGLPAPSTLRCPNCTMSYDGSLRVCEQCGHFWSVRDVPSVADNITPEAAPFIESAWLCTCGTGGSVHENWCGDTKDPTAPRHLMIRVQGKYHGIRLADSNAADTETDGSHSPALREKGEGSNPPFSRPSGLVTRSPSGVAGDDAGTECGYEWGQPDSHDVHRCTLIGSHSKHVCVVCSAEGFKLLQRPISTSDLGPPYDEPRGTLVSPDDVPAAAPRTIRPCVYDKPHVPHEIFEDSGEWCPGVATGSAGDGS